MSDVISPDLNEQKPSRTKGDGWLGVKPCFTPFRPEGCDFARLEANEAALEARREEHTTRLVGYLNEKGYTLHPNTIQDFEDIFALEYPYKDNRIVIPKYIITTNQDEDLAGKAFILRRDIPILCTLVGLAHEATHLDRYAADPAVAKVMEKMFEDKYLEPKEVLISIGPDGKITPEVIEEEVRTDTQAFFLLKDLGIEIEPENYSTYTRIGKLYKGIVSDRIKKRLLDNQS